MKIVFDNIIFSLQRAGGISVVWENLLKSRLRQFDVSYIEYSKAKKNLYRKALQIHTDNIIIKSLNPKLAELINPRISYNGKEYFIFHSSYFRICNHPKAINVTTVHDFIYEQGVPTFKQRLRIKMNYKAIRNSDAVVCISENTKKDLFRFLPDINPEKVYVIYNGVSEDYYPIPYIPYPQYRDCVLFIGGRQGYKNFRFTVEALSGTKYNLLVCGKSLDEDEKVLLDKYLPNHYTVITLPSNEELNKIYNSVYALVYPSSYEGFGIPILEAQRSKCPVIALNSSSVPEVAGEGAILLETLFRDALIEALDSLDDRKFKSELTEKGYINSQRFSWEKMAETYLQLYKNLLDDKNNNQFS